MNTSHVDPFNGPVPCTPDQCAKDYEYNTGKVIVDLLDSADRRAAEIAAALVANHGPFIWSPPPPRPLRQSGPRARRLTGTGYRPSLFAIPVPPHNRTRTATEP
ncbi:hypothetical protein [Streptomyces sp. cg40]|uniref:hypothetical protein n=1 Tax=Streptomyces sp. cg40 TaxID=3419764 RepID=UPI003D0316FE